MGSAAVEEALREVRAPVEKADALLNAAGSVDPAESGATVAQKLKGEAKKLKFGVIETLAEEHFLRALSSHEDLPAAQQQPSDEPMKAQVKELEQHNESVKSEVASLISSICRKLPNARVNIQSLTEQLNSLVELEAEVAKDAPATGTEEELEQIEQQVQHMREQAEYTERAADQLEHENAERERAVEAAENETQQITSELSSLKARESGARSSKELLGEAEQALHRGNEQYEWLASTTGISVQDVKADSITVQFHRDDCCTHDITIALVPGTQRVADIRVYPATAPVHDIVDVAKKQQYNGLQFAVRESIARVVAATRRQQALRHAKKNGVSVAQATKGTKIQVALTRDCTVTIDAPWDWPLAGTLEVLDLRSTSLRRSAREALVHEMNHSDAVAHTLEHLAQTLDERRVELMNATLLTTPQSKAS